MLQHRATSVISCVSSEFVESSAAERNPPCRFNPVANTILGKALQRIIVCHGLPDLPRAALDGIIHTARGDLRHAITSLQFFTTCSSVPSRKVQPSAAGNNTATQRNSKHRFDDADGGLDDFFLSAPTALPSSRGRGRGLLLDERQTTAGKKRPRNIEADNGELAHGAGTTEGPGLCGRDDYFDSLHSLGKLLHAKRGEDGRLEYEPESIMVACAYDARTTAAFLSHNAITHFCDLGDLSAALDVWSSADVLVAHGSSGGRRSQAAAFTSGGGGAVYPEQHAASLVSRAISTFNKSPAPRTFRPTRKPTLFAVERIACDNLRWITSTCLGLSRADILPSGSNVAIDCRLHVPSTSETCVYTLPILSLLAAAERQPTRQGRASTQLLSIGPREQVAGLRVQLS